MAFAVRITKTAGDAEAALYTWESTNGRHGHVRLEIASRTFRPADEHGVPFGAMAFRVGDDDATDPDQAAVQDFLTVVGGIIRKWKADPAPPETAHLYFG